MRNICLIVLAVMCCAMVTAQRPLYVVNGVVVESIQHIPQEDIESIDTLPADEQSIATWGLGASEGVIIVTLHYDTPAMFNHDGVTNFTNYLAKHVKWSDNMPAERVSLRLIINENGKAEIDEVLDVTSRQYLKRVTKAIEASPMWQPAMRNGKGVASQTLVNLQLPVGKELPREHAVIIL